MYLWVFSLLHSSRYCAFDGRVIMSENVNRENCVMLLLLYSCCFFLLTRWLVCVSVLKIIRFSFGTCDNKWINCVYSYIVSIPSRLEKLTFTYSVNFKKYRRISMMVWIIFNFFLLYNCSPVSWACSRVLNCPRNFVRITLLLVLIYLIFMNKCACLSNHYPLNF